MSDTQEHHPEASPISNVEISIVNVFGSVEQSYRDQTIDYQLWIEFAHNPTTHDIALEAIHEANQAVAEGVDPRNAFLRGVKFATRLERSKRQAEEMKQIFFGTTAEE